MFRQVIIATDNKFTLQLPNELVGKKIEITAKPIVPLSISSVEKERVEIRNIFKDCRVSLSDFIFDRDEANNYNG